MTGRYTPSTHNSVHGERKTNVASKQYMEAMKNGKKQTDVKQEDRYHSIYKQKIAEVQKAATTGVSKYTFNLPGTDATAAKEMSPNAQAVIKKIAEKRTKREQKKLRKMAILSIHAKSFTGLQGGRVDSRGFVYDSRGQWILTIDKKTGKIRNRMSGNVVGRYKPNSTFSEYKLCELIRRYSSNNQRGMNAIWGPPQSVWGDMSDPFAGSVWGGGGSSFWGQDNTGGFWGSSGGDTSGFWGSSGGDTGGFWGGGGGWGGNTGGFWGGGSTQHHDHGGFWGTGSQDTHHHGGFWGHDHHHDHHHHHHHHTPMLGGRGIGSFWGNGARSATSGFWGPVGNSTNQNAMGWGGMGMFRNNQNEFGSFWSGSGRGSRRGWFGN